MELLLDPKLSIDQNAAVYFEKAKKARKKSEGLKRALEKFRDELLRIDEETIIESEKNKIVIHQKSLQWFEKFRWFVSSDGFLCVGGRDATSNDIIVKKHAVKGDIVFHTSIPGSPFFVVKSGGSIVPKATLDEVAVATASFSRAWREGFASTEVYHITPEQVLKSDPSGISLPRGSFYIDGRKTFYNPILELAIGKCDDFPDIVPSRLVMCAPISSVQKWCSSVYIVRQGDKSSSDVAKKLSKEFGVSTDDIIRVLPSGGVSLKRVV
ncbi:DUF814 domain-containing protein [Candidatus Woesearchaeota archaeon]|nr:DUF814 domain-containing protein [Candidatus Woesearchaeota archaeon]